MSRTELAITRIVSSAVVIAATYSVIATIQYFTN